MESLGFSRRSFLKLGAAAGGLFAGSSAISLAGKTKTADAVTYTDKTYYELYNVDPDNFPRFSSARTAFGRTYCFPNVVVNGRKVVIPEDKLNPIDPRDNKDLLAFFSGNKDTIKVGVEPNSPGYTQLDGAVGVGAGTVLQLFGTVKTSMGPESNLNIEGENGELYPMSMWAQTRESFPNSPKNALQVAKEKWEFPTPEDASYAVKKMAKTYGAGIVGVADFDRNFLYKDEVVLPLDSNGKLIEDKVTMHRPVDDLFTFEPKSVIVIGIEMPYEEMSMSPSKITGACGSMGYSGMAEVALKITGFVRALGYNCMHTGNNVSLNIPEAIRAGLGEDSRMSLLITPEFGPRLRLATIYTDLELKPDKIKQFGVREFCEVCQVCTDTCPSGACKPHSVYSEENKPVNISGREGILKYYNDPQLCRVGWVMVDSGCNVCISTCPYNKPQTWNHELVKVVTLIPGLNSLARYFDHFFGFGQLGTPEEWANFWRHDV